MGSAGMAEMGEMEMPMPDNTLPMMTGFGQFGPIEMGGMFSVVKVREGLARERLQRPRLVPAPAGHRGLRGAGRGAYGPPVRRSDDKKPGIELKVVKPRAKAIPVTTDPWS